MAAAGTVVSTTLCNGSVYFDGVEDASRPWLICTGLQKKWRVNEHEAWFDEKIPETLKVAAPKNVILPDVLDKFMDGCHRYQELGAKVTANETGRGMSDESRRRHNGDRQRKR